jgi:hypothetical protein
MPTSGSFFFKKLLPYFLVELVGALSLVNRPCRTPSSKHIPISTISVNPLVTSQFIINRRILIKNNYGV